MLKQDQFTRVSSKKVPYHLNEDLYFTFMMDVAKN